MKKLIDQILRKLGYIPLSSLPTIDSLTIKEEPFHIEVLRNAVNFRTLPTIDAKEKAFYELRQLLLEEVSQFIEISEIETYTPERRFVGEIKIAIKGK